MLAIEIDQLVKQYKNGVRALDDLSLKVNSGEIFSLLGPNGAEKSSLINILTTFYKTTSGNVIMLGKDLCKEAVEENNNIEVDTVHKYQGRERDVVILTTVVNEINEFVDQPNLINVAVSRAVDKLIVVVSDNEKNENSNIGDLVKYIEYNNFEIINSNIYSVFDLLYHRYSEHLFERMKNRKNVPKYESENLINAVIEKVLNQPEFGNLDRVMHQPLKMLIRNAEKHDEAECRFAMNVLTHTGFVVFNKLNKMPVLVVEVDGTHSMIIIPGNWKETK